MIHSLIIGIIFLVVFSILFLISIPIFVVTMSFLGIFIPLDFIYNDKHFDSCWLKHEGIYNRFWHFIDTRANILSFDGEGSSPLKNSPNRMEWLKRRRRFLERVIPDSIDYGVDYREYCKNELLEINQEIESKL